MTEMPLCLLTVHAHPDDEASKGAPTCAMYHARGVRTVLVCCTGGEEGDIHNPAMDRPEVREDLGAKNTNGEKVEQGGANTTRSKRPSRMGWQRRSTTTGFVRS